MDWLFYVLIGSVAGLIMRGRGASVIANLIVGVIGALLGSILYEHLCQLYGHESVFSYGLIGSLTAAFVGAILLLLVKQVFTSGE